MEDEAPDLVGALKKGIKRIVQGNDYAYGGKE